MHRDGRGVRGSAVQHQPRAAPVGEAALPSLRATKPRPHNPPHNPLPPHIHMGPDGIRREDGRFAEEESRDVVVLEHQLRQLLPLGPRVPLWGSR